MESLIIDALFTQFYETNVVVNPLLQTNMLDSKATQSVSDYMRVFRHRRIFVTRGEQGVAATRIHVTGLLYSPVLQYALCH